MGKFYITKKGLEKLKEELAYLKKVKRKEVSERIKKALEGGDISESGEYAEAKEEQAFTEGKIAEISNKIKNAVIIESKKEPGVVDIGSTIFVKFDNDQAQYTIIGSSEANPSEGKISNESPIGKAFLGHEVGDIVEVETPSGLMKYEIVKIE
jgi:transcription elongation factor GreA